jgi:multidrug efflux system membrane fusion protein
MPEGAAEQTPAIRVRVETATARLGRVARAESSTGTVRPWQRVTISAQVGGEVRVVSADVGDRVEEGAALLRVDDSKQRIAVSQAAAQLEGAKADHAFARSDLERVRSLVKRSSLPAVALDEAQLRLDKAASGRDSASASLRSARRALEDTVIVAPFAGVVTARRIDAGATINPGMPLVDIVDLSRVRVQVGATGVEAAGLTVGDPATVRVADLGGLVLSLEVGSVGAVANDATGLFDIELRGENPGERVRGGMLARVELPRASISDVVVVPRGAVTRRDGEVVTFAIQEGVARMRVVRTGLYDGTDIEVLSGLAAGEAVATSALHSLAEGVLVDPAPVASPTRADDTVAANAKTSGAAPVPPAISPTGSGGSTP